jgi:Cu-Zn family superoxide dismutase
MSEVIHSKTSAVIWAYTPWPVVFLALALFCCTAAACDVENTATVSAKEPDQSVKLKNTQGQEVGMATLSDDSKGGVTIHLMAKNLPAGEHAFHLHQFARCEPPAFATAGPHFNPDGKKHGLENPDGPHAGDMNNFTVAADGTADVSVNDTRVSLGTGPNSVYTEGGTALVIHAKADDMKTDPSGNAGDRIACGEIMRMR